MKLNISSYWPISLKPFFRLFSHFFHNSIKTNNLHAFRPFQMPHLTLQMRRFTLRLPHSSLKMRRLTLQMQRLTLQMRRFTLQTRRFILRLQRFTLTLSQVTLTLPRCKPAMARCYLTTPQCKTISCVSFCLAVGLMQRRRYSWPFLRYFCFAVVGKRFCLLVLRFFHSLPF